MGTRSRISLAAAAAGAVGALAVAPAAGAGTAYHPDRDARAFGDSAGGWAGETANSNEGCAEGVSCPAVEETFVADDGADGAGDGYIASRLTGLASLLTTTTSTLVGPPFTYGGDRGERPARVRFSLQRRSDDGALLSALSGGEFTVVLDDLTAGTPLELAGPTAFEDTGGWVRVGPIAVPPRDLVLGHDYRVRIVNRLELPLALIPSGSFDYDNVVLRAVAGGRIAPRRLRAGIRSVTLRGRRLAVRLRCPAAARQRCSYRLVARAGGPRSAKATQRLRAKVRPGTSKRATAPVKPRWLAKLKRKRRLTFTGRARTGSTRTRFVVRLRLTRR